MKKRRRINPSAMTVLRVVLVAGLVGSWLLLQRPEAAVSPTDPKFGPFYPGWPEFARRFINGGLLRGAAGVLYDSGFRRLPMIGTPHTVESTYRTIWESKAEAQTKWGTS